MAKRTDLRPDVMALYECAGQMHPFQQEASVRRGSLRNRLMDDISRLIRSAAQCLDHLDKNEDAKVHLDDFDYIASRWAAGKRGE